ncbi:MAG: hypothetical protein WC196_05615 [Bacilli bacterium]|jgi:hypothetical protein
MSTQLYVYRFPKKELWSVLDHIKEWYKENHIAFIASKSLLKKAEEPFPQALDMVDAIASDTATELQLFELEDFYYMRVLEKGYFFMNHCNEFPELTPIFYDTRSDVPEEMQQFEYLVDIIDDMISNTKYLIYPLVTKEFAATYFWKIYGDMNKQEKITKE